MPISTRLSAALRSALTLMAPETPPLVLVPSRMQTGLRQHRGWGEAGSGITTHSNIIAIGSGVRGVSTAFGEVDNACYIGNIAGAEVSAATFAFVIVDADGKLGTLAVDANGNKVTVPGLSGANPPQAAPQRAHPQAIGPDPKQAMLNPKVEKQQATIAELKSTVVQQQKQIEKQQKQMEIFTAQLKEQAAQIQKVSAQLEMNHPPPQMVVNNH